MGINLTVCTLADMLARAREDYIRYQERFQLEGVPIPEHKWESWLARHVIQQMTDLEYNKCFPPVNVTADQRPSECDVANSRHIPDEDEHTSVG